MGKQCFGLTEKTLTVQQCQVKFLISFLKETLVPDQIGTHDQLNHCVKKQTLVAEACIGWALNVTFLVLGLNWSCAAIQSGVVFFLKRNLGTMLMCDKHQTPSVLLKRSHQNNAQ